MSARAVTVALFAGALGVAALAFGFLRPDDPPATTESLVPAPWVGEASMDAQSAPAHAESGPEQPRALAVKPQTPLAESRNPTAQPQARPGAPAPTQANASHEAASTDPEQMEKRFATEAVDANWGPGMEATIYEQIGEIAGPDIVTVRSECKTTLCRLQVTQRVPEQAGRSSDESPRMYEMWETLFARLGFASLPVTSTADANGIVSSVVYLPRGEPEPAD